MNWHIKLDLFEIRASYRLIVEFAKQDLKGLDYALLALS